MRKLPLPIREFKFYKQYGKNWRADLTWKTYKIIVECDGGIHIPGGGRHQRPQGYEDDCVKLNHAMRMGYQVYRFTKDMITRGEAINFLETIIGVDNE